MGICSAVSVLLLSSIFHGAIRWVYLHMITPERRSTRIENVPRYHKFVCSRPWLVIYLISSLTLLEISFLTVDKISISDQ